MNSGLVSAGFADGNIQITPFFQNLREETSDAIVGFFRAFSESGLAPYMSSEKLEAFYAKVREKLEELDMMKLRAEQIIKIIDLLPENQEDLNKIVDILLEKNETKKILETIKEFK